MAEKETVKKTTKKKAEQVKKWIDMSPYTIDSPHSHDVSVIDPKLQAIQDEIDYMQKKGRNTFNKYNYLMEAQVTEQMKELCTKHKVRFHVLSSEEISHWEMGKNVMHLMRTIARYICTETGQFYRTAIDSVGADTLDKGINKAITAGVKYMDMKNFHIPTGDDPEGDSKIEELHKKSQEETKGKETPKPQKRVETPVKNEGKEEKEEVLPITVGEKWNSKDIAKLESEKELSAYYKYFLVQAEKDETLDALIETLRQRKVSILSN